MKPSYRKARRLIADRRVLNRDIANLYRAWRAHGRGCADCRPQPGNVPWGMWSAGSVTHYLQAPPEAVRIAMAAWNAHLSA